MRLHQERALKRVGSPHRAVFAESTNRRSLRHSFSLDDFDVKTSEAASDVGERYTRRDVPRLYLLIMRCRWCFVRSKRDGARAEKESLIHTDISRERSGVW